MTPPPAPLQVAVFLDDLLDAERFRAQEPENGLLIDARRPVRRIGAAVNTTLKAIDDAAAQAVDLLLVHHPSWPLIDLWLHDRKLKRLGELGISLYGAHASLDAAPDVGTGDALARLLGIDVEGRFADYMGGRAGVYGSWSNGLDALVAAIATATGAHPEVHANVDRSERVAIVAGAGSLTSWLGDAMRLGCDTYVTGEGSMYTRLFAREAGLNLIFAGHYRTEAPGVKALARRAAERFGIEWTFVEDEAIG